MDARFVAFAALAALLIVTPGPDMALVTRNALRHGRAAASITSAGIAAGSALWGLASVLGLAVLLERSALAFTIVKLAGAAYLLVLGALALVGAKSGGISDVSRESAGFLGGKPAASRESATAFAQGVLGNLLNPKAGVIFVTVFPQFLRPGDSPLRLLLMLAVYEAVLITWLNLYGYLVVRGLAAASRTRLREALNRLTGVVLIGLGVRLAVERT